jgi:hypothetical protein
MDMEIRDIIKSDSDRLFIVDPECYIIFTGETTDDIKPFIRIGTWNDMPVELIPLIENIIITDSLIGNPAHEQFNIDVRHLPENRYIGSRAVVRKFFDYQRIFGLDLTNASVVDIEKDLPELSKEKNISHKDQFIGVFYRDGNFKVLLNKNTIFDLNSIIEKPISWQKFHDLLSEQHRGTARFDGSGLVVIGHNPFFYDKKHFYPYLFPGNYLRDFSLLGIDPGKIQAILHPSLNLINISKLFKWLNNTNRKINIFANSTDIDPVKRLFSHAIVRNDQFSNLDYRSDTGLEIRNYPGSFNLKVTYNGVRNRGETLTAAFIKGPAGVRDIIREKLDIIIITYSAYEDIHILLRSTGTPVVIVDDGNRNVAKLGGEDRIILSPGIHYEFRTLSGLDEIETLAGLAGDTAATITGSPESLAAEIDSSRGSALTPERRREIFNLLSMVRVHLYNTRDRKLSSQLRSIAGSLSLMAGRTSAVSDPSRSTVVLALFNGAVFPFITDTSPAAGTTLFDGIGAAGEDSGRPDSPAMAEHYDRILADRERLRHLIDIYARSARYNEKNMPELGLLKEAIGDRKSQYGEEALSLENSWSRSIASSLSSSDGDKSFGTGAEKIATGSRRGKKTAISAEAHFQGTDSAGAAGSASGAAGTADAAGAPGVAGAARGIARRIQSLPAAVKIALPLGLILIIAALLFLYPTDHTDTAGKRAASIKAKGPVAQSRDIDTRYRQLGIQLNIKVKDHDIYRYANEVAVKNGYYRIAETRLRERNPDWIYPENVFIMLDFQPVVVSKGDTLWNLSKNKLIESTIKINDLMRQFAGADKATRARLVKQIKLYAFTAEQMAMLKQAEATLAAEKQQVPGK